MLRGFVGSWGPWVSLVLGSACGPIVVLDDEGSGDASDEASEGTGEPPSSTTTAASTTSAASSTTSASTTTATTATTATTSTTGDEPSYCGQACVSVADCAQGGDPDDFACIDGFCEYVGEIPPCDPGNCDDLMIGFCTEIDGVSVCAMGCSDDSACIPGFTECTGHDDAGNSVCMPIPCFGAVEGEPCEIEGVGQLGVCTDGVCACTDDSQCTLEGYACDH